MSGPSHNYGIDILYCPCIESGLEVATDSVTDAGMSYRQVPRSWRLVVEVQGEKYEQRSVS